MPVFTSSIEVTADYPTIKPSLNLNFARSRSLDPRITFTRASVGTYVGRDGLIKTAGEDEARFDHDPDTLESLGLLLEESRTNRFLYSDLTTVDSTSNATTSRTTGLDGNSTSALNVTYTSAGAAYVMSYSSSVSASTQYTFSVWIKRISGSTNSQMYSYSAGGSAGDASGTIYNTDGQALGSATAGVWKRYIKTFTTSAGTTAIRIIMPGYDSNGLNVHYYGAQIEQGAFPTSCIPTSASAVTRAADYPSIDRQMATGNITIVGEYKMRMTASNQWNRLFGFGEGTSDVRPFINANGNITWYNYSTNSPTTDWSALGLSVPDNSYFRFAFAIRQNVANSVSVNGTTVDTQTNTNPGAYVNWTSLYLGNADTGTGPRDMTGHIKEFRIYNDAFTDAQLQLLSK